MTDFDKWKRAKDRQFRLKTAFIENLIEDRQKIHRKQLDELLAEECELDTVLMQVDPNNPAINTIRSALVRVAEQRRHLELDFWKEISQLKQALQDLEEGVWK